MKSVTERRKPFDAIGKLSTLSGPRGRFDWSGSVFSLGSVSMGR
ncbi:hypothetical protein [Methylobacterium sp. CM6244]